MKRFGVARCIGCLCVLVGVLSACQPQAVAPGESTVQAMGSRAKAAPGAQSAASTKKAASPKKKDKKVKKKDGAEKKKAKVAARAATQDEIQQRLCGERLLCRVLQTWDAGKDEAGRAMKVVEVTENFRITDLEVEGAEDDPTDPYSMQHGYHSIPLEYWLVFPTMMNAKAAKTAPVLLAKVEKARLIEPGADLYEVQVAARRFALFSEYVGEDVHGEKATVLELPTMRVLQRYSEGDSPYFRSFDYALTNVQELSGVHLGYDHPCTNSEERPYPDNPPNYFYEPIAQLSLPRAFRDRDWKTVALDTCASTVSGQGSSMVRDYEGARLKPDLHEKKSKKLFGNGFVTHGKPGSAADASFKVVMASPSEMYIDVRDDKWVPEAGSILHTDHLELWARTSFVCPLEKNTLFQWGIGLDGKVQTLYGKPVKSPTAESTRVEHKDGSVSYRFKIKLPDEKYQALTVVYSDSDDGKSQKRLIATSNLKYRDAATLGKVEVFDKSVGTCEVKGSKLKFVPASPRRSPLLEATGG